MRRLEITDGQFYGGQEESVTIYTVLQLRCPVLRQQDYVSPVICSVKSFHYNCLFPTDNRRNETDFFQEARRRSQREMAINSTVNPGHREKEKRHWNKKSISLVR